jgi:hypothetical protein
MRLLGLTVSAAISLWTGFSDAGVVSVTRTEPNLIGDGYGALDLSPQRIHLGSSERDLLGTKRSKDGSTLLSILAMRVEFPPPSEADDCGVTGDGRFDLSGEDSEDRDLGAPPHNKRYFENQLEALSRFYAAQSYDALDIDYRVVPDHADGAYMMPRRTAYYGNPANPNDLAAREVRLARLFKDAIEAADADSLVRLGDYDAYVVFHAGGDWQHDYLGDSPCDPITAYIPSVAGLLGNPIIVDDSTHVVDDGIVMPEAVDQDLDRSEAVVCIQSELAHEFGHQLGLLDLYYVNDFSNCVGYWAMMDNGDGIPFQDEDGRIIAGVLPPSLCIYSKMRLGWLDPLELEAGGHSAEATTISPSGYRATVSNDEYFLLENRATDTDGDDTVYLQSDFGVVLGPTTSDGSGTTSEYDAGLPGSGLLIWHVDESITAWEGGPPNALFYDPEADTLVRQRGVALEEAPGYEDLGFVWYETDYRPEGTTSTDPGGMPDDPFYAGNNDGFGDETRPASWDNSGRRTHIEVRDISTPGPTMTFTFERTWSQPGWPIAVAQGPMSGPTVFVKSDGSSLIVAAGRGVVHAFRGSGAYLGELWDSRQVIVNPPAVRAMGSGDDLLVAATAEGGRVVLAKITGDDSLAVMPGWPQSPTGRALSTPALVDVDGDGSIEVALGSDNGTAVLLNQNGSLLAGWPVSFGVEGAVTSPAVADLNGDGNLDLVFGAADAGLYAFDMEGNLLTGWPVLPGVPFVSEPLIADLEGDGTIEIFMTAADEAWLLNETGSVVAGWPVVPDRELVGRTAIAHADDDGMLDVIAVDELGGVWAWAASGTLVQDYFGRSAASSQLAGNAVLLSCDADADMNADFITGSSGLLRMTSGMGYRFPGWPLSTEPVSGASLADIDGDSDLELVVGDSSGTVSAWDLPYGVETARWSGPRGNAEMTGWAGVGSPVVWPDARIAREEDFYCWPSPVTEGEAHFAFCAIEGAEVRLTVFDAAGNRRAAWVGTARGGSGDEWLWDVSVPTGIYFCRLEATFESQSEALMHRFSVVRGEE